MSKSFKSVLVLVCICATVAVLLAVTNAFTAPIIEKNEQKNANAALLEVLPDGGKFDLVDITSYNLPTTVKEVYRAEKGGYVIKLETTGYASGMVLMCGISDDGHVSGTKLIASQETPTIGGAAVPTIADAVVGKTVGDIDGVDSVSGATKTTEAYRGAVEDALNTVVVLGGGTVDFRTEEEILNDNLSAALPESGGSFTKHFFAEVVEGVDAIYVADNKTGYVCVVGEAFIAVDASGKIVGECDKTVAGTVITAIKTISKTTSTDIDLTKYNGLPKQLISAKITNDGNYIIDIKGVGYGIVGGDEYHPASNEYIIIRVSLTAEGRIIDCLTVSQAETDGIGSACADEKFYGQFDGRTEENYNDIEAISGATKTTKGYTQAIFRAFESVKIFEGGNK